jgi:hypothetical protein
MRVSVVTDLHIDDNTFKNNLPSSTNLFVCSRAAGTELKDRSEVAYTRKGFIIFDSGSINIQSYTVDDNTYQVWDVSFPMLDLNRPEYKTILDNRIRAAFREGVPIHKNEDGIPMKLGEDEERYYCGREMGVTVMGPRNTGQCGPDDGLNCPACRIAQAKIYDPTCVPLNRLCLRLIDWIDAGARSDFACTVHNAGLIESNASKTVLGAVLESVCKKDDQFSITNGQGPSSFFRSARIVLSDLVFYCNGQKQSVTVNVSSDDYSTILIIKHRH